MDRNIVSWLVLVVFTSLVVNVLTEIPHDFNKVMVLQNQEEFENLINTKHVAVVYYYKREVARIRHFFKEFDKSAEYLAVYGVVSGIVDCRVDGTNLPTICQKNGIEHSIYTYRDGEELLILDLETMFDVNSIMSNVLQLVLLHEVPIIQNRADMEEMIDKNKGKTDVIFSYQKAIGTYEHRIFMEVAFAYQDKYAFAVTTERDAVESLRESDQISQSSMAAIWALHCKDITESYGNCIDVKYKGKMDLPSLAKYLRSMTLPKFITINNGYEMIPYAKENLDCLYLVYDTATQKEIDGVLQNYKYFFHGIVGIVLVNMNSVQEPVKNKYSHVTLPGIGLKRADEDDVGFMASEWSGHTVAEFITENILYTKPEFNGEASVPPSDTEYIDMKNDDNNDRTKYNLPSIEDVETQDDQVADSVFRLAKQAMSLNTVSTLTDQTYSQTITNSSLLMVLFYIPFDAKSMAFLRAYGEASELLVDNSTPNVLARMNCYDWTDVCGKENVFTYPTIRVFKKGKYIEDYNGLLDTQAVVRTIRLLQIGSPIKLHSSEKVMDFIDGRLPANISQLTNTSILGVFDSSHKTELSAFSKIAKQYMKTIVFGVTDSTTAKTKSPAIIIIRHNDPFQKDSSLTSDFSTDSIAEFIENNRLPVLPELTAYRFPDLFKRGKPLVILFLDEPVSSDIKETLANIAKSRKFTQFTFCWMDITSNRGIGEKILNSYTQSSRVPAISIVNNKKGDVYNYPGASTEFSESKLIKWFNEVLSKMVEPSKTLPNGDWKPSGRSYDFLSMMDYEAEHGQPPELINNEEISYEGDQEARPEEVETEELEARAELIQLGNSRLYHTAKDRKSDDTITDKTPTEEHPADKTTQHPADKTEPMKDEL
ncbi:thioredoxin domain-containing protein 16 [Patella vulgata]|uniref:thioredoxin domain-containing protein 16 n=1 Tax=Patella vulgata TaxID=6465 RepID=UPI00217F9BB3|nr:thioredoxin domain-containing protein 16 [Patella vulgata]